MKGFAIAAVAGVLALGGIAAVVLARPAEGTPSPGPSKFLALAKITVSPVANVPVIFEGTITEGGDPIPNTPIYAFIDGLASITNPVAMSDQDGYFEFSLTFSEAGTYTVYISDQPQGV